MTNETKKDWEKELDKYFSDLYSATEDKRTDIIGTKIVLKSFISTLLAKRDEALLKKLEEIIPKEKPIV